MDVIIVCHTEFGHVEYNKPIREVVAVKSSVKGVEVSVKKLAQVADMYGAKVTFAIMPETVRKFPEVDHEIGLHIHPGWKEVSQAGFTFFLGDAYLREHCAQAGDSTVLSGHSFDEQLEMINVGKDCISDFLGVETKVFVAGMWSINSDTVKALLSAGFTHECSAVAGVKTPRFDWSALPRICMPYNPQPNDYQKPGNLPLVIVPISQMLAAGNVNPEAVPLCGLGWLKACFTEYYKQSLPVFHICLHSPCMTDPFFVHALAELLQFIRQHDVEFKYASEVKHYGAIRAHTKLLPYAAGINKAILQSLSRQIWRRAADIEKRG